MVDGLFAEWDTTGLSSGFYTLRLRARDRAEIGCGLDAEPNMTEDFRAVAVGAFIFFDGFESGGATGWTSTFPES